MQGNQAKVMREIQFELNKKNRAQRCRREAAGFLRCAAKFGLEKVIADRLRAEAARLIKKAVELDRAA